MCKYVFRALPPTKIGKGSVFRDVCCISFYSGREMDPYLDAECFDGRLMFRWSVRRGTNTPKTLVREEAELRNEPKERRTPMGTYGVNPN